MKFKWASQHHYRKIVNNTSEDRKRGLLSTLPLVNRKVFLDDVISHKIIICEEKEDVIGLVQFNVRKDGSVYIQNIWVSEEHRHKGIGSNLLSYFQPYETELKCKYDNDAKKFYLNNNYKFKEVFLDKNGNKMIKFYKEGGKWDRDY